MTRANQFGLDFFFPDKMAIKLNMFYKFMEHRILSNMDGHLVVTVDWDGWGLYNTEIIQKILQSLEFDVSAYSLNVN